MTSREQSQKDEEIKRLKAEVRELQDQLEELKDRVAQAEGPYRLRLSLAIDLGRRRHTREASGSRQLVDAILKRYEGARFDEDVIIRDRHHEDVLAVLRAEIPRAPGIIPSKCSDHPEAEVYDTTEMGGPATFRCSVCGTVVERIQGP